MRPFKHFVVENYLEPEPNTRYGSNEGGIHSHPETGERFYVKHYRDPDQGRAEVLTSKVYDHMGIKTLSPEFGEVNGRHAVYSKWRDDLQPMHHSEFKSLSGAQHEQLGRIYHGAVLTKNWDVIGLAHDNVLKHRDTGEIHSIDHGGAFHFRARGGPKDFGPDVGELHSLRHNDDASGEVFGHVLKKDPNALAAGHEAVAKMDMKKMRDTFASSGLPNHAELFDSFSRRRDAIMRGAR